MRCQFEALTHHVSTLAATRRAVNRKSELNELRAELAELRALVAAKPRREPKREGAKLHLKRAESSLVGFHGVGGGRFSDAAHWVAARLGPRKC